MWWGVCSGGCGAAREAAPSLLLPALRPAPHAQSRQRALPGAPRPRLALPQPPTPCSPRHTAPRLPDPLAQQARALPWYACGGALPEGRTGAYREQQVRAAPTLPAPCIDIEAKGLDVQVDKFKGGSFQEPSVIAARSDPSSNSGGARGCARDGATKSALGAGSGSKSGTGSGGGGGGGGVTPAGWQCQCVT